jgi:hypothetical protein
VSVVGELPACFTFLLLGFFCFSIGPHESAPEDPCRSGYAEQKTDEGEPATSLKLLIEKAASKQPNQNTERKLEPDGPVTSDTFPVMLHRPATAAALA